MNALVGIAIFIALFVIFGFVQHGKEDAEHGTSCPGATDSPACGTCPLAEGDDDKAPELAAGRRARGLSARFTARSTAAPQQGGHHSETGASAVPPECPAPPLRRVHHV